MKLSSIPRCWLCCEKLHNCYDKYIIISNVTAITQNYREAICISVYSRGHDIYIYSEIKVHSVSDNRYWNKSLSCNKRVVSETQCNETIWQESSGIILYNHTLRLSR
jgi:hypothetical protein